MIEVVRGRIDEGLEAELIRFWAERGALDEGTARARIPAVVCVLRDDEGRLAGVNSAFAERVPLVGDRMFWIYRMLLDPDHGDRAAEMLAAACDALAAGFEGDGPIGVCALLPDPAVFPNHERAYWAELEMLYAGYTDDGRQIRLRYFEGARV